MIVEYCIFLIFLGGKRDADTLAAKGRMPKQVVQMLQRASLTLSHFLGLVGYAAVKGYILEPFFWTILVGIYGLSLVKRRDDVSSAIGELWV